MTRPSQFLKASVSILVTVSGIAISVNDVQSLNEYPLIVFRDFPHSIFFRLLHPSNALSQIVITVSGSLLIPETRSQKKYPRLCFDDYLEVGQKSTSCTLKKYKSPLKLQNPE